jgi:hypothetical protein
MSAIHEILVLHHSHLDVGYTHSQPVVWEMHREYIDQALHLLDETAGWPEPSRPKWTCEVTEPVLRWLATASARDIDRFKSHTRAGRLAICAMRYNYTPLPSAGQFAQQLGRVAELRGRLGAPITAAIQHDINGLPWPLADLLLDAGVGLFIMGVNRHLGNHVGARPGIFRWLAPSGRELRVMNGNHYTMFDQIFLTWENSLDSMRRGWSRYETHLSQMGYPHDFVYLTATASPEMWDNSPPNSATAALIRRWNEQGLEPSIRFVTAEDLRQRIQQLPAHVLPLLAGDWTDYWNFGCATTAANTARACAAQRTLASAGLLAAGREAAWPPALREVARRAADQLALYQEHTWSYWDTAANGEPCIVQDQLKAAAACEAGQLADYLLTHELEALAANPPRTAAPDHVLVVNPTSLPRSEYLGIPSDWRKPGPRLRCQRFVPSAGQSVQTSGEPCGPIELPPFGWKRVPLASLQPLKEDERVFHKDLRTAASVRAFNNVRIETARTGHAIVESPRHRLTFDPVTGRILALRDKALDWEVLPPNADYGLLEFVRERPDALVDGRREAYYERDLEKEKYDQSCWKNWKAVRERATGTRECRVTRNAVSVTLDRSFDAPGTTGLRQRITLRADSPVILIEVELDKLAHPEPESIYFALPLNLPAGWRCHFDTAGLPVELDAEQLPGACRNWFTAESYAALHTAERGVTLFCPDAPMVQAGGFQFGPPLPSIPRGPNPLLLAWPLNNYWHTNYPLSQPGRIRLRYGLATHGAFAPLAAAQQAAAFAQPLLVHPAFEGGVETGRLLELDGEGVSVLEVRPDEQGTGVLLHLLNLGDQPAVARLSLPGLNRAAVVNALGETMAPVEVEGDTAVVTLCPRRITIVHANTRKAQRESYLHPHTALQNLPPRRPV